MKSLILFSCFVPSFDKSLSRIKTYINHIKSRFYDCDVMVSVDPDSIAEGISLVKESFSNVRVTDEKLISIKSEAAGFQQMLGELSDSKLDEYDAVYFAHTFGITHKEHSNYQGCIGCFKSFLDLDAKQVRHPLVGSLGLACSFNNSFNDFDEFFESDYKAIGYHGILSLYILKAKLVKKILSNRKLLEVPVKELGFTRNFFEQNLCSLASKNGFLELYKASWYPPDKAGNNQYYLNIIKEKLADWFKNNNINGSIDYCLEHHQEFLDK